MAATKRTKRATSREAFHQPEELPPTGPGRRRIQNRMAQRKRREKLKAAANEGAELTKGTSHIEQPGDAGKEHPGGAGKEHPGDAGKEQPGDAANDREGSVQSVAQCSSSKSVPLSSPSLSSAGYSIVTEHEPQKTDTSQLVIQRCLSTQRKLARHQAHAKAFQPRLDFTYPPDYVVCSDTCTLGQSSSQSNHPKDTGAKHVQQYEGAVKKLNRIGKRFDQMGQQGKGSTKVMPYTYW